MMCALLVCAEWPPVVLDLVDIFSALLLVGCGDVCCFRYFFVIVALYFVVVELLLLFVVLQ
jgi:hypothetical protein